MELHFKFLELLWMFVFFANFMLIVLCSDLDSSSSFMINHFVFIFNSVDQ